METLTTFLLIVAFVAVGVFLVIKGIRGSIRHWPARRTGEEN